MFNYQAWTLKKLVLLCWHNLLTLIEKISRTFHMNNRKYNLKLKWSYESWPDITHFLQQDSTNYSEQLYKTNFITALRLEG